MKHELKTYLTEIEQESLESAYLIRNDINNLPLIELETYNIISDLINIIERENNVIEQLDDKISSLERVNYYVAKSKTKR